MAASSTAGEDDHHTFSTFDIVFLSGVFRAHLTRLISATGSSDRDTGHESAV
jgi:hypothetical protein